MSEYQYVGFRAIEKPVSEKNLEYMHQQSSRAEITPWSFDNEYHFGDFHGNASEMLRRGYDIHLHYANFGTRTLMIRIPRRLTDDPAAAPYFELETISFDADKESSEGILRIDPCYESGDLDYLMNIEEMLERLKNLRGEILDGDLRPLFLGHLAVAMDFNHDPEETPEGPVPAGLEKLTPAQEALAELYGLSSSLIAAAARGGPRFASKCDTSLQFKEWLLKQPQATKDAWLAELTSDSDSHLKSDIRAAFRKSQQPPDWPTVTRDRTIAELWAMADEIQQANDDQSARDAARARAKELAPLAADPSRVLLETEELAKLRKGEAYDVIVNRLSDLREALADTDQSDLAEKQAQKLKKLFPTLRALIQRLKEAGFLAKEKSRF